MCEYRQDQDGDSTKGWAIFGVLSCIFAVSSTLFCCGGFIYKTRVMGKCGIDALPGMTIVSACLETVSGAGQSYSRAEDLNSSFASEALLLIKECRGQQLKENMVQFERYVPVTVNFSQLVLV